MGAARAIRRRQVSEIEDDPDWQRAEMEAERKDPNYATKLNIESIETTLRYGLPGVKFVLWVIAALLGLILWRVWH
jgi:hypothetical protein